MLPPAGVYASLCMIEDRTYRGMSDLGTRPTVEAAGSLGLETHLFDCEEDLYGKTAQVVLLQYIRAERRFPDTEALKAQLEQDRKTVLVFFAAQEEKEEKA